MDYCKTRTVERMLIREKILLIYIYTYLLLNYFHKTVTARNIKQLFCWNCSLTAVWRCSSSWMVNRSSMNFPVKTRQKLPP